MKVKKLTLFAIMALNIMSCKSNDASETSLVPAVSVKETSIVINEKVSRDFSLEITTNVPVVFNLPNWITEKDGNTSALGKKTYSFQANALPEGTTLRTGDLTVKSADASLGVSIAIAVKQSNELTNFRIATYNILYENWEPRESMVIGLIKKYDFDIFGVQEAYQNPQLLSLTSDGTYAYTGTGYGNNVNSRVWYNAILYKKDRFELLNSGAFYLSETPDIPSVGWDDKNWYRNCSWGKFKDNISGSEFYVFNTHFASDGAIARRESAKLLLSKIKSIAGDSPVFAIGDYNLGPTGDAIQTIVNDGLLRDSYIVTEKAPTGPVATCENGMRVDYIFVTKDIRVKEYGVLNDRPNGKSPSDHDPVLIVAEF